VSRDIRELERWIVAHPRQAWSFTIGGAILIFELALLLRYALAKLAAPLGGAS